MNSKKIGNSGFKTSPDLGIVQLRYSNKASTLRLENPLNYLTNPVKGGNYAAKKMLARTSLKASTPTSKLFQRYLVLFT